MKRGYVFILLAAVCAMTIAIMADRASAQQGKVIELTYGTPFAQDHTFSRTDQKWIAKMEKDTNGRVKIKPFWGGQVITGRDQVEELASGVADIAYTLPSNTKTGFELSKAMTLFFAGANVDTGTRVMRDLRAKFPEIEKEYTDAGVKVLMWTSNEAEIICRKPVRKIADLKGMRLKVLGDFAKVLKEVGAEGVGISNAEVYVSMQKGILDGTYAPIEVLESLKMADVAKYVPQFNFYQTPFGQRCMSLTKWKSLPPDIQKVFESNMGYYADQALEIINAANVHAMEFAKKAGVEFIPIPNEDKAKMASLMVSVAEKDAKGLDAKGYHATQILQEAQKLITQYNGKRK